MPDLDIVERRIRKHWRGPYRLIKGNHPIEVVSNGIISALAEQLRVGGGAPGASELLNAVRKPVGRENSVGLGEVSRQIEQRFGQEPQVKVLAESARRLSARIAAGRALPSARELFQDYLPELVRHHLLGRVSPTLVGQGKRFRDRDELARFEADCLQSCALRFEQLAKSLQQDPSGQRIRAPQGARPSKISLLELLERPFIGGAD